MGSPIPSRGFGPLAVALGVLAAGPVVVVAQTKPDAGGGPAIYTCVDDKGRRLTSDRPIPECLGREQRVLNKDGSQWLPRPAAVAVPSSTAEVEEIMRFCSSSQFMAKPLSTGFHTAAAASNKDVIVLDLKSMNRIVEIDVKNQIAARPWPHCPTSP